MTPFLGKKVIFGMGEEKVVFTSCVIEELCFAEKHFFQVLVLCGLFLCVW